VSVRRKGSAKKIEKSFGKNCPDSIPQYRAARCRADNQEKSMSETSFNSGFEVFGKKAQHSPSYKPELNPAYAVKDFLQIGESSVLYGAPGLGKTAIVAAIAAHVATGRDFGDFLTEKTVVTIFAAEDKNGVHKRAYPYLHPPEFSTAPFYVVPTGFNMMDVSQVSEAINFIQKVKTAHGLSQALVVFDTLNRMLGQYDENSSTVIGSYFTNVEQIALSTNSACLTIHHSGKGATPNARGSSAILGNADNVFRLASSEDDKSIVHVVPEKTKDIGVARTLSCRIGSFKVGVDRDGAERTVAKATPQGTAGIQQPRVTNENRAPRNASMKRRDEVERILLDEADLGKGQWLNPPQIAERTGEAFRDVRANRDSHLKAVKRALKNLCDADKIKTKDGQYRVCSG